MPEEGRAARDWSPRSGGTGASRYTLKKTRQFVRLFQSGRRFKGKVIRARYCGNTLGVIRLGFSVSRKSGNAVARNLFRRRLRQLAIENASGCVGIDAVVAPLMKLREIDWVSLRDDFMDMIGNRRREEASSLGN
jgi:ribonuclease P protein component